MGECRNCGATSTLDLGFVGDIAPFFLKRVLNLEYGLAPSPRPLKRALRGIPLLRRNVERIYGSSALTEMQICRNCWFIQTKLPFPDEALARLYADYRSDSYNRERVRYEPEYAAIASQVGSCGQELRTRTEGLTRWLGSRISTDGEFSMLDYGGAEGRFLPDLPGKKYVFDISSVEPAAGITRIESEAALGSYSYVQLAHILEHVSWPLALTRKAASCLKASGHLYVEVPQDLSDRLQSNWRRETGTSRCRFTSTSTDTI